MDKNTATLTVGLGLIGIVLAFLGYQSSETDASSDEVGESENGSGHGRGRGDEEGEISQARTVETAASADEEGDKQEANDTVVIHSDADKPVVTMRSQTPSPSIQEDVKQEIAKEADTWDSFWKQEYEKQNEENDTADF